MSRHPRQLRGSQLYILAFLCWAEDFKTAVLLFSKCDHVRKAGRWSCFSLCLSSLGISLFFFLMFFSFATSPWETEATHLFAKATLAAAPSHPCLFIMKTVLIWKGHSHPLVISMLSHSVPSQWLLCLSKGQVFLQSAIPRLQNSLGGSL